MERDLFNQDAMGGTSPQLPRDGPLAGALLCVSCGYDLRGLDVDGNCPECGASIEISMHPAWLLAADSSWLARVVARRRAMIRSLCISAAVVAVVGSACVVLGMLNSFGRFLLVPVAICLLQWVRLVWALTARHDVLDRGRTAWESGRSARGILVALVAGAALVGLMVAVGLPRPWVVAAMGTVSPVGLLGLLGVRTWCARLRWIAVHTGDRFGERQALGYATGYSICWACAVGFSGLGFIGGRIFPMLALLFAVFAVGLVIGVALCPLEVRFRADPNEPTKPRMLSPVRATDAPRPMLATAPEVRDDHIANAT